MTIENLIAGFERDIRRDRDALEELVDQAERSGRKSLTTTEDARADLLWDSIRSNQAKLERAKAVKAEEDASDAAQRITHDVARRSTSRPAYDQVMRVGAEPMTYRKEVKRNSDGSRPSLRLSLTCLGPRFSGISRLASGLPAMARK